MNTADNDLLDALRTDPEAGFRRLVRDYGRPLYWHIRRLVVGHADAEDALQETLVRAFRSVAGFRGDCSFKSWLYRLATNEALRLIAGRRTDMATADAADTQAAQLAADAYVDYTDLEAVRLQQAILALPEKQRVAFNLRYYDELSYDDIAAVMQSSPATAKANYHYAKERIVKYMNTNF